MLVRVAPSFGQHAAAMCTHAAQRGADSTDLPGVQDLRNHGPVPPVPADRARLHNAG